MHDTGMFFCQSVLCEHCRKLYLFQQVLEPRRCYGFTCTRCGVMVRFTASMVRWLFAPRRRALVAEPAAEATLEDPRGS